MGAVRLSVAACVGGTAMRTGVCFCLNQHTTTVRYLIQEQFCDIKFIHALHLRSNWWAW